jgi:glutamine synthetase
VKLADEIFYFKRMIREAALRHNCYATFMAKPIEGEPGSAMHIHHSIVDKATGQNIFSNPTAAKARPSCISSAACSATCPRSSRFWRLT